MYFFSNYYWCQCVYVDVVPGVCVFGSLSVLHRIEGCGFGLTSENLHSKIKFDKKSLTQREVI
jgi:hypothetical protein